MADQLKNAMFTFEELDLIKANFEQGDKNKDFRLDYEEFKSIIATPDRKLV